MCSGSCSTFFSIRRWEANSLSFFVLWTLVFSLLAHREFLVYALHATRLGWTNFPTRWTFFFFVIVWLSWTFACLFGLKTLCSSVVSMKTSAARRPEAFLTNCHAHSRLPLNFSHFSLRLDSSSVWWCIQAHLLLNSPEDGVVQLPFKPALRLRLFFRWTARTVFPLEPFLLSFPCSVFTETRDFLTLLLAER